MHKSFNNSTKRVPTLPPPTAVETVVVSVATVVVVLPEELFEELSLELLELLLF